MKKVLAALGLAAVMLGGTACGASGNPGAIGIVHNGGPFDNTNIRQVLPVGAGYSWIGLNSTVHYYPSDNVQRFWKISPKPGSDQAERVCVPTADGVNVCLEGQITFTTAFNNSPAGEGLAKEFDLQYGLRTYPVPGSTSTTHAYSGDTGWSAFLDAIVQPVIDNELRQAIGKVQCQELVSSCALVASGHGQKTTSVSTNGQQTQDNIQQVQQQVETGLQTDVNATLGKPYLENFKFVLGQVTLPATLQTSINKAQSEFAAVSATQAQVQQAKQQNAANRLKEQVYRNCPACAQIDEIKALQSVPAGVTVLFGIQNPNVTVPAK